MLGFIVLGQVIFMKNRVNIRCGSIKFPEHCKGQAEKKVFVSSCLIGRKCSYDGEGRPNKAVIEFCKDLTVFDACPEILGGAGCPREKHEILDGTGADVLDRKASVISIAGKDNTDLFVNGAKKIYKEISEENITKAILKNNSPSCGKGTIYSGGFNSTLRKGNGVTAEFLLRKGIEVFTEIEIENKHNLFK